jgi:kinetochore protein NDC80
LTILEREKAILESDNEKYKAYIEHLEAKKQKLSETVVSLKEEFKSSQLMVQNLEEERVRLTNIIDQQEISPADVDRMNAERDQLSKSIALVCEQLDVVNKQVWNKEIEIQKKMDTIERLSEKCNSLLYQLDLIGNTTAQFECLSQELSIYIQNQKAEDMCSINLRKQAKPAIHSLLESIKATTNQVMDESIALQEQIDLAGWNVVTKEEEIAAKQSLIKQMNEQYVNEKQVLLRLM